MQNKDDWEWEIKPEGKWFEIGIAEVFSRKDLLMSFFRRELLSGYNQTIIGVFWIVLQPLLTTLFYFIVFSRIVKVSTDNVPPILFYMSGSIIWSYFSDCLTGTMYSHLYNAHIYSKVYFPRLIVPMSTVLNHSVKFGIQFLLFIIVYLIFYFQGAAVMPSVWLLFVPLLMLQITAFSFGLGLILSVLIARYRDVEYIMNFLLRLWMFITPVVYPTSIVPEKFRALFWSNPLTPIVECFRSVFFNSGPLPLHYMLVSTISILVILAAGVVVFKRREIKVMDTI